MGTNTKRDWTALGIEWSIESVARQAGENASDKTFYPHKGPLLIVSAENLPKFIAADAQHAPAITSHLDGQSFRVAGQRVLRAFFEKGGRLDTPDQLEALKERAYASVVLGARAVSVSVVEKIVERRVVMLPGGGQYEGSDLLEFRQLYAAELVDHGVNGTIALGIASSMQL